MSSYLIGEIAYNPRITVLPCSEVVDGGGRPARVDHVRDTRTARRPARCRGLFLLLGAEPHCDWLPPRWRETSAGSCSPAVTSRPPLASTGCRRRASRRRCRGSSRRATSGPGSMKRVAAASGEGASVVPLVHAWLDPTTGGMTRASKGWRRGRPGVYWDGLPPGEPLSPSERRPREFLRQCRRTISPTWPRTIPTRSSNSPQRPGHRARR